MKCVFCALLVVLCYFWVTTNADANLDIALIEKELPATIFKEVSVIPDKPHFLLGVEVKTDEWEQYLEKTKLFQTKDLIYGYNGSGFMDKSRDDLIPPGNTQLTYILALGGKQFRILYTHHHYVPENRMYFFWSVAGEKNMAEYSPLYRKYEILFGLGRIDDAGWKNIQRVLGWAQFEAVKIFTLESVRSGLASVVRTYGEMNLTARVLASRSKILDDPDYVARLDEEIAGTDGLRNRDILPVPLTRPQDFAPDLIVIGPRGFYGGFANYKTPGTERIVFLDLLGLALRYIGGFKLVEHEFVHTNPYLQGSLLSIYYDVEMWAEITANLEDGITSFLFHPYFTVIRDMVRTMWGYDYQEVRRRIWPGSFGARDVREQEFRKNAREVRKILVELQSFVKDPEDGVMVRFYTDPYFWITVNTKMCDTAAVWRVLFASRYEPAGIFDPDKKDGSGDVISPVLQTKEWLMKEEEAGRIKRLGEEAMKKVGELTELGEELAKSKAEDTAGFIKCPVHSRFFSLNDQEKMQFRNFVEMLAKQAKAGNIEANVLLMRIFGGAGPLARIDLG